MSRSVKRLIYGLIITAVIFGIGNAIGYWYECGKEPCYWNSQTKGAIIFFTIMFGGGSTLVIALTNYLNKK